MAQLFGFEIKRASKEKGEQPSFVLPDMDDGASTVAGFYSEYLDLNASAKNEYDLVRRYRSASEHPECDFAIEDIINESSPEEDLINSVSECLLVLGHEHVGIWRCHFGAHGCSLNLQVVFVQEVKVVLLKDKIQKSIDNLVVWSVLWQNLPVSIKGFQDS